VAVERAEKEVDVVMPGFTHLQSAQTVVGRCTLNQVDP
jgi:argininosuccinate lyase